MLERPGGRRGTNLRPAMPAIQYRLRKCRDGYEWRPACEMRMGPLVSPPDPLPKERESDWALAPVGANGSDPIVETVQIEPDLYLKFSSLKATQDLIKKFAADFGLLGLREEEGRVYPSSGKQCACELQSAWQNQIVALDEAVELWRMIRDARDGNGAELGQYVRWSDDLTSVEYVFKNLPTFETHLGKMHGGSIIAHHLEPKSQLWNMFHQDPIIAPATYRLRDLVGRHGGISAMIDWDLSTVKPSKKGTSAPHLDPDSLGIVFYPENLIAALWLQFAEAIAARRRIRRCLACRRWMSISASGDGLRAERRSCEAKCRTRLYLWRREAIKQLGDSKLSAPVAKKIARSLDIDEATLKELLDTSKKEVRQAGRNGK
jgi:hypothetical protein